MTERVLADVVVVVHLAFFVFVAVGGVVAWRWPKLLWAHVVAVLWGVLSLTVGVACPLTSLEKHLRRLAGETEYAGGFVDHYLENVVYSEQLTPLLWAAVAAVAAVGYAGALTRSRRGPDPSGRTRAGRPGNQGPASPAGC